MGDGHGRAPWNNFIKASVEWYGIVDLGTIYADANTRGRARGLMQEPARPLYCAAGLRQKGSAAAWERLLADMQVKARGKLDY